MTAATLPSYLPLFPTAVAKSQLRVLNLNERAVLEELGSIKDSNMGNQSSSNHQILKDPRLADLTRLILEQLQIYVDYVICPRNRPEIAITQSWLNFSEKGEWHHAHAHGSSWLSACFYIAANPEYDQISFEKNRYDRLEFELREYTRYNATNHWLPVASGDLVIFPSELKHGVSPVQTDTTRVSLALNTWFNGLAGDENSLTALGCRVI